MENELEAPSTTLKILEKRMNVSFTSFIQI
jgi:hypothetical protein